MNAYIVKFDFICATKTKLYRRKNIFEKYPFGIGGNVFCVASLVR